MFPSIRIARHLANGLPKCQLHTTSQLNFKFKLTEEMSRDFEEKKRQEEASKKKTEPALHTKENPIIMGKVSHDRYKDVVKVAIPKHRLNEHLLMYIRDLDNIQALDENNIANPGDWVLLRKDPELVDPKVTHKIERVIYSYGKYIDPITGRRSLGIYFDDDMERLERIKLDI